MGIQCCFFFYMDHQLVTILTYNQANRYHCRVHMCHARTERLTGMAAVTQENRWRGVWAGSGVMAILRLNQSDHVRSTQSPSPLCMRTTMCVRALSNSTWCASSWSLWVCKRTWEDIGGNCPAWFPFYISFLHKSFYPCFSLLGNPRRKSLTCLDMEHNCPKTGPDPNESGAKLSQTGLDTKTKTGAIRIMLQSPCNGQWWGNHVWLVLFVFFDCSTNSRRAAVVHCLLWWSKGLHIFFDKNSSLVHSGRKRGRCVWCIRRAPVARGER